MQQKRIKVFIADDHPIIALGIRSILREDPCRSVVGQAESSDELFKALPDARPHVLLLDLNMPGNDFYRNIELLRREFPWLKVLIYTAYEAPDLVKSLLDAGAHGFLLKSASPTDVREAIDRVFAGDRFVGARDRSAQAPSDQAPGPESLLKDNFRRRLRLSKREQEILVLISRGLTSQGIGKTLYISKYTVETHRKNILRKLELNSSTELVKFAIKQGLV